MDPLDVTSLDGGQIVTTPEDLAAALTARRRVLPVMSPIPRRHPTGRVALPPANLTRELLLSPASTVIATATALSCIVQFAENRTRPSLIAWLEL